MRILIVASEFPPGPGGIGTHAFELARHFVRLGHEVEAVVGQDYVSIAERDAFNARQSFGVFPLAAAGEGGRWSRLRNRLGLIRERCRRFEPDCVLASGDPTIYMTAWVLLGKSFGKSLPWLAVEHGRVPGSLEANIKRWSFENADHVVAVSAYSLRRLKEWGVRPKASSVVHNGADSDFFRPVSVDEIQELRYRLNLGDAPFLLTTGSVHARKGQDLVVRALPKILKAHPEIRYVMAGLPHEGDKIQALAQSLGVEDSISLLGAVSRQDLRTLYSGCSLFLMTSRNTETQFEGFGIAAVEAALCGRPAVVNGDSGLSEAVLERVTGRTVPPESPEAIGETVSVLLSDEKQCLAMGEAAAKRARSELTWNVSTQRYESVLRDIVGD